MNREQLNKYVLSEQHQLIAAMKKAKKEDIWFSDIETAIVRAVNTERTILLNKLPEMLSLSEEQLAKLEHIKEQYDRETI